MHIATPSHALIAATILGVLGSSLVSLSAVADDGRILTSTVKFGDLDVSRPQGASALYGRIRSAAAQVCSPFDRSDVSSKLRLKACISRTVAVTVASVSQPALSAVYDAKNGTSRPMILATLQGR